MRLGSKISRMVSLACLLKKIAAVLDPSVGSATPAGGANPFKVDLAKAGADGIKTRKDGIHKEIDDDAKQATDALYSGLGIPNPGGESKTVGTTTEVSEEESSPGKGEE